MNEEFKRMLLESARRRARQSNFEFTSVAETDVKSFIDQGVDKMNSEDLASDNRKNLAESNLLKLVDSMANQAKRDSTGNLNYKTFSDSRKSICPLWPFC